MRRCLSLSIVLLLLGDAAAGHYKYSSLHWEKHTGNTVHFTLRSAWSTEFQPYKDQVDGRVIRLGQVIRIQGLGDPVLSFGDGAESFQIVKATVTSVDHVLKTWVGEAMVAHTYATQSNKQGQAWMASFGGCCRDSDVKNRNSGYFNVSTSVHLAKADYIPIIAMLPRQIMMGGVNSRANGFWVPGFDSGMHSGELSAGARYTWEIKSQAPPMTPLNVDATTGLFWGQLDACRTQAPSTACLYAMRVAVKDVATDATSEVDFEIEVLPSAVTDMPRYINTSSDAVQPLPAVNSVYSHYAYTKGVHFQGDTLEVVGQHNSALPQGAQLSPGVAGAGGSLMSNLSWTVPQDTRWRVVCMQAYNNGTQAYRDSQNRTLPVRSRQVCMDWSGSVDPAPQWLSPVNWVNMSSESSEVRAVYMGEQMSLDLTAQDKNVMDVVSISASNLPSVGGLLSAQQQVGGSSRTVNRTFTFSPPEKLGGLEGKVCFAAADTLRGQGGGGKAELCLKYRVPKCLYRVKEGQTLLDIASLYGVNWLQLWALNKNISRPEGHGLPGGIKAGDVLHIGQLVLVKQRDSLERMAARFGTTLRQIIALNHDITPTRPLTAGQLVCLVPSTCMDKPPLSGTAFAGLTYA